MPLNIQFKFLFIIGGDDSEVKKGLKLTVKLAKKSYYK